MYLGLALVVACSGGAAPPPPSTTSGPPVELVTLGGDETSGADLDFPEVLQARWTDVLFRTALPSRAVHHNLAQRGRTIADGVALQLPLAVQLSPTLVTVWFGPADDAAGTGAAEFHDGLERLLGGLETTGAHVYVAVGTATPYDGDIATVADEHHATTVDVAGLPRPLGVDGHAEAARRFAGAIGTVE